MGKAASFDGVDDYLASDIPTVDTSVGFSVSAWAKLDKLPDGAAVIAAQPGNNSPGFELYYTKTYDRWAFNQYSADTAAATPVRVMQASAGGAKPGVWTHLVGSFSTTTDDLRLYVNGVLVSTVAYDSPWDARRGLQIGAGSYDGAPGAFFPGTIDDVRIFDKPLGQDEITALYGKQDSVGTGRPARAVFPLDEAASDADGNATSQMAGQAQVNPAVFKGGAKPGETGRDGKALSLDGVDDYATTTPHVNNARAFSVVAWAKLPKTKPTHAAAIIAQTGTNKPGFELYYSATYGWTFNQYGTDAADAASYRATQGSADLAPGGEWTQVAGSYDAVDNYMRLYVQGKYVSRVNLPTPFYAGGPIQIGASKSGTSNVSYFPGQLSDIQLYDRALSAQEMAELFDSQVSVEGRWKLDAATGSCGGQRRRLGPRGPHRTPAHSGQRCQDRCLGKQQHGRHRWPAVGWHRQWLCLHQRLTDRHQRKLHRLRLGDRSGPVSEARHGNEHGRDVHQRIRRALCARRHRPGQCWSLAIGDGER